MRGGNKRCRRDDCVLNLIGQEDQRFKNECVVHKKKNKKKIGEGKMTPMPSRSIMKLVNQAPHSSMKFKNVCQNPLGLFFFSPCEKLYIRSLSLWVDFLFLASAFDVLKPHRARFRIPGQSKQPFLFILFFLK